MITKPTKVLEPGSFRARLDDFIKTLKYPLKSSKSLEKRYNDNKLIISRNNASVKVDFPSERKDEKKIMLNWDKLPEVTIVESPDKCYFTSDSAYFVTDDGTRYELCDKNYYCPAYTCEFSNRDLDYICYIPDKGWTRVGKYYDTPINKWTGKHNIYVKINPKLLRKAKFNIFIIDNFVRKPMRWVYDVLHTIDSTYLCLRFPLLYTRNRFNGKHYNNPKLLRKIESLQKKSEMKSVPVIWPLDETEIPELSNDPEIIVKEENIENLNNKKLITKSISIDGKEYVIFKNNQKFYNDKTYYPVKYVSGYYNIWNDEVGDFVKIEDINNFKTIKSISISNDGKYEKRYYDVVFHPVIKSYADFLSWIHDRLLQIVFCIPKYSEIDDMPEGWFRAFGMDMLKELKNQLKKDKFLHDFRITQIKEKWGGLRFYVERASKEVYGIISKYEDISYKKCIDCGKPAKYMSKGWISPYCPDCVSDVSKYTDMEKQNEEHEEENENYGEFV